MPGILYLVAVPIGNYDDITIRAINVLKSVDVVVCEERNEGHHLLKNYNIEKQIETLNEHNEDAASSIIIDWLKDDKKIALISDSGTPVFSDPGRLLVQKAIRNKIRIVPVPGASSLLPALIVTGFNIKEFVFAGFLSPKRERRIAELKELRKEKRTIVIMDTPYRLIQLTRDIAEVYGETRKICVAFNITHPSEEILYGTAPQLYHQFLKESRKGEFVIVIEGK